MAYTWEKDADDIHRAFAKFSADKAVLIGENEILSVMFFLLISAIFTLVSNIKNLIVASLI